MKRLFVVGSINMDLVGLAPRFVAPGETLLGSMFAEFPGGKGANQAVALARLGAQPVLVGALGDDDFGKTYRRVMDKEGVDHRFVETITGIRTGVAMIEVAASGENRILVLPGANSQISPQQAGPVLAEVRPGDIVLFQLEIPLETVLLLLKRFREKGAVTILDPAPAFVLPRRMLELVDFLTPNETESRILAGLPPKADGDEFSLAPAQALLNLGVGKVIQKAGSRGAWLVENTQGTHVPAFAVAAVDTTAAGDSFNAGFAFALAQDKPVLEAIRWANAVAALSTTQAGAQTAMPSRPEVEELLLKKL